MLIPERTIDMWTAVAVHRSLPDALVWGPTPREQSRNKPWDVSVRDRSGKLIVIENKGVKGDGSVLVDRAQLRKIATFSVAGQHAEILPNHVIPGGVNEGKIRPNADAFVADELTLVHVLEVHVVQHVGDDELPLAAYKMAFQRLVDQVFCVRDGLIRSGANRSLE